jgi:hypothetical protein
MWSDLFLLGYKDSNPDKQNQNLLCYRYTITQSQMLFFKSDAKLRALKILCKFFQENF